MKSDKKYYTHGKVIDLGFSDVWLCEYCGERVIKIKDDSRAEGYRHEALQIKPYNSH